MSEKDSKPGFPHKAKEPEQFGSDYPETPLKDLILTLWGYRRSVALLSAATTIVMVFIAGFIYLRQDTIDVTKLKFKLDFEGIDKNEYPNGTKFSTSDILSTPVLKRVYEVDRLNHYLNFPDFKASLAIFQRNDELTFLEYKYSSKLSDKKLTVEQRNRLEEEFLERKKNVLHPIYTLAFFRDEKVKTIPFDLRAKMLNDILRSWAEYAVQVKGADRYQVSLVSRSIINKGDIENEGLFISTDVLRSITKRIRSDIEKLKEIPGASTMKIGDEKISLTDLEHRNDNLERYKISPLAIQILQSGDAKQREIARQYLESRVFELGLDSREASAGMNTYQNALTKYTQKAVEVAGPASAAGSIASAQEPGTPGGVPAMIPQFGTSFLDSLIAMAREQTDIEFRQEMTEKVIEAGLKKTDIEFEEGYYEGLYDKLKESADKGESGKEFPIALPGRIREIHQDVFNKLTRTIDELHEIYLELSRANLNPASLLYTVIEPVTAEREKTLNTRRFILAVLLTWILAEGVIIFGVFVKNTLSVKPGEISTQKN